MSIRSGDSMHSLQRERSQLQREVADWKLAKRESDGVIRRIVALVPRDVEHEDIVAAVKRTVRERDEAIALAQDAYRWALAAVRVAERKTERLTERYVGNREDCGHLKCFTRAPGLLVEGCLVCESADALAQIKAVRDLRHEMIACPDCPQPACRAHYDRFGKVYVAIMEELRW